MRSPEIILDNLMKCAKKEDYKFERLYRNLYNPKFYLMAYSKLAPNSGNLTEGVNSETIDGFSMERVDNLIQQLKSKKYQPHPARRTYIPKKNGKQRPLGIPSFNDKLVQEVIRLLLEAIYEPNFQTSSHGFRPNRSCHTALTEISTTFTSSRWFIEGDIRGFFDNIDHQIMTQLLKKKINDDKFIRLIWKFLKAGYVEDWKFHKTYSGTPQGGIISPVLSNIYLHELDTYIEKYKNKFNIGKKKRKSTEYKRLEGKMYWWRRKMKTLEPHSDERKQIALKLKEMSKQLTSLPYSDQLDPKYKRLKYVRYCDDFIIGIVGSKEEAQAVKSDLEQFLMKELKIELSREKTLITHTNKFAKFLGYNITISRDQTLRKDSKGVKKRYYSYNCRLYTPKSAWADKLKSLGALRIKKDGTWQPMHRPELLHLSDLEILSIYNAEIRGLYNYYALSYNTNVFNKFLYVMKYSMFKTFANKYKSSISKISKKYKRNGVFTVQYETKAGTQSRVLYNEVFSRKKTIEASRQVDNLPEVNIYTGRTELTQRLSANQCEWCGTNQGIMEVHHIKKLKDLKGKAKWEKNMIARRRKTLVLCHECHVKLHKGQLD
ncbi:MULTISPECIES: reverse transcriptase domain-containing protein [Oceanobacillus]|uniref:Reverse transcriptase domain-containing protein n=1 Tax=Oceanobacillus aidingensis TaxID=645964 RepID=A0ABV9JVQ9_9BACI|nr:reverse transcriptase domain-containing protein [Oceanobacillus oncorhynchi]MDM8101732.1 reverse transcriptase domain-containing protein [Oceanobacillus oncorhynchi]